MDNNSKIDFKANPPTEAEMREVEIRMANRHGHIVAATLTWLHNADTQHFESTFGDDAGYLWNKHKLHFKRNDSDFFIYLDGSNRIKLMIAVNNYLTTGRL